MAEKQTESLNIYQKLAKIRAISDVVTKDKKGYNYTYADITEILAKVTAGMKKQNVSLVPQIVPGTSHVEQNVVHNTKVNRAGDPFEVVTTEMLVGADMVFRWVNDDNPEDYIDVPWFVVGAQGDPSQAFGSGLTYCTRYFLTSFFQIAQADSDVDAYRSKQKEAQASEDRAMAEEIVKEIDKRIRDFLADNPDKKTAVEKMVTKYVKSGNYTKIKEPNLAGKLLSEFKETFLKGE